MIRDKKSLGLIVLIIIIFSILFIRFFILFIPDINSDNNKDESYIFKQSYSIYNGTEPEIIAENFANALNESPIKSKHEENCCGGTKLWRFELQNDNHLSIETRKVKDNNSILLDMRLAQSAYHEKNLSYDAEYAKNIVLNFSERFLKMFDVELGEDYTISVLCWHKNSSWHVDLYQIYEGKFINGSGFHAIVDRENGEIRTMDFGDWLHPKNKIEEQISIDDGKTIIYNELIEDQFNIEVPYTDEYFDENYNVYFQSTFKRNHTILINLSDIEFIEYKALWGRLCYRYEINFQINETTICIYQYIIDVENGRILFWSYYSGLSGVAESYYNNLI